MNGDPVVVELHGGVIELIVVAAGVAHPLETGGLLLGWWDADKIVIRHAVEVPDPSATTNSWTRDEPQAQAVLDAALTTHEHPWLGYVGDWHTHPGVCGASRRDISSICRASRQYDRPLALLVHRADGVFDQVVAHRGRIRSTRPALPETDLEVPS
jgi:proteasome lid subunit RPN8/RPN11